MQEKGYNFRLKIGGFEAHKYYNMDVVKDLAKKCEIFDKIDFVGVVKDKRDFFDVDILRVPSRLESFGMVILEGFLHSTLVIFRIVMEESFLS